MKNVSLCFQVHHPFHLQTFRFLDIGGQKSYYDDQRIEREINEAVTNYYLPSNEFLLQLISQFKENLKVAFYISGTAIDQFMMYEPEVISSFRQLADTGQVEFLGGTASHSLITLTNQQNEIASQLKEYQLRIKNLFGKIPKVFVNTDLIYSDFIGKDIYNHGYHAMITNGSRKTLAWQSPNYVYSNYFQPKMHVCFRNELISNELEFKLNNLHSNDKIIHANGIRSIINNLDMAEPLLNIYLNYKALGGQGLHEKQRFIKTLTTQIINSANLNFILPSEITELFGAVSEINSNEPVCWINNFHSNYYPGNELQVDAIKQLYKLNKLMENIVDPELQKDWQYLQTSDHIHLMDEQHPAYQENSNIHCIYNNKYDAFINFMNILDDFKLKLKETGKKAKETSRSDQKQENIKK